MDRLVLSLPTIPLSAAIVAVLSAVLLLAAYGSARAGLIALALACVLVAGASIRMYAASEGRLHDWDERFHVVVARHLIQHPLTPTLYDDPVLAFDYRDWTANHVWLHKPPLALWLIAGSLWLFGISEIAARLPSVILSTIAIALTFAIGRRLFSARVGLLAAGFHALNGMLVALAAGSAPTDHVDTVLIVLIELGVWLTVVNMERGRLRTRVALGLILGLAVLTKWYPALLMLVPWLFLSFRQRSIRRLLSEGLVIMSVAAAIVAPWAWYILRTFPREAVWEWRYGLLHSIVALEEHSSGPLFFVANMPKFLGELVYVPIAWATVAALRSRSLGLQLAAVWVAVPYTVFSLAATRGSAYVFVAAPAVFLMEAWFWWELAEADALARHRMWRVALLFVFAFLPSRYLLRPGGPFTIADRHPHWVAEIESLREGVVAPRPVLFNMPRPIEAMFYLPWPAYGQKPTDQQGLTLSSRGYSVLIYDRTSGVLRAFQPPSPPVISPRPEPR